MIAPRTASLLYALECPRIVSTDLDYLRLLSAFGDSGSLTQSCHEPADGCHRCHPW